MAVKAGTPTAQVTQLNDKKEMHILPKRQIVEFTPV